MRYPLAAERRGALDLPGSGIHEEGLPGVKRHGQSFAVRIERHASWTAFTTSRENTIRPDRRSKTVTP